MGGGNSLKANDLDESIHYLDDFSFLDVKQITNTPEDKEYLASLGLTSSNIKGDDLPNGTKFTIFVYKGFSFVTVQEFELGKENPKIELDAGVSYHLCILSLGYNTLKYEFSHNFSYANIYLDNSHHSTGIFHQRIANFTPTFSNNILDIKLKPVRFFNFIIDTSNFSIDGTKHEIISVKNAKINYMFPKDYHYATINSSGLSFSSCFLNDCFWETFNIEQPGTFHNDKTLYKMPTVYIPLLSFSGNLNFTAEVEVKNKNSISKNTIFIDRVFTTGKNVACVLELTTCGAYMGPNKTNYRNWMCKDLGEIVPNGMFNTGYLSRETRRLTREKYHWGKKYPVPKDSEEEEEEPVYGDWLKKNNPCPIGYRIPTMEEFKSLTMYNELEDIREVGVNGSIALKVGNRLVFFETYYPYWTSTYSEDENGDHHAYTYTAYFVGDTNPTFRKEKLYQRYTTAKAIRCIKKLPNEE